MSGGLLLAVAQVIPSVDAGKACQRVGNWQVSAEMEGLC